ncbi:MAG: DUF6455 family protein [Pseudomonadota bacterium]|jgi:hypothetical protein
MRLLDRLGARLDQSAEIMDKAGMQLGGAELSSEHEIRNTIWRCLMCRHGEECRQWIAADSAGVPNFCPNKAVYQRAERTRTGYPQLTI